MNAKRAKHEAFPMAVKAGSSTVKIYQDRKPSGDYFRVVYHLGGRRHRLNFRDLEAAKVEAQAKASQLARGDVDAVQLTGRDRLTYGRALDAVKEFGIPLDAAALEYAEARKQLVEGHSLIEAVRFHTRHCGRGITAKPVDDAVIEFRQSKSVAGRSPLYLKDIDYRLRSFARAFHCDVRQLTPQDVADFLGALKFSPRSFNNHARLLGIFFRFCQARGWLSRATDLLGSVESRRDVGRGIEIFTSTEMRRILTAAPQRVAACIALQAFAGVRTAEFLRLHWTDLERRPGYIEISAGKAKTASRRLIPIAENLAGWLADSPRFEGRIWPATERGYHAQLAAAAKAAGMEWKANGLRHSFISYRLAATSDVAKVALEAGNSPAMIFRHYRELATEAEAAEWFGIVPAASEAGNVVRLAS
jgi:integrase